MTEPIFRSVLSVPALCVALAVALAGQGLPIFEVNAWNVGTAKLEPWRARSCAAVGQAIASVWARLGALLCSRAALTTAAVLLALLAAHVNDAHAHGFVLAGYLAPGTIDLADVKKALDDSNAEIAKRFKGNDDAIGRISEVLMQLQAELKRGRLSAAGGHDPDAAHPFLFGKTVREEALAAKSISGSVDASGGFLLSVEQNLVYAPRLVAQSAALAAGIRFVPSGAAEVKMPIEGDDPTAYWVGEGDTITESTPQWALGNINPRKLAALVGIPNEMLQLGETMPFIGNIIENRMARAVSGELDRAIFEGNGVAEPLGLENATGIETVSMGNDGATFTSLDPFADAIGAVLENNANPTAIVVAARDWTNLLKLKEQTSGNNKPLLQESAGSGSQGVRRSIYGIPVYLSSRLSTTETQGASGAVCSSAYVFDAAWLAFIQRQALQIAVDSSRLFHQDKSEIRATLRGNLATIQPSAVCRIKGIKAS
jgi:HK97 family phage major capsid protein